MNDNIFSSASPSKEREQVEVVKKQQQEYRFIGNVKANPGHTLFEYNRETHKLRIAEITTVCEMDMYHPGFRYRRQCNVQKNCIYLQALNIKNAAKKLIRSGFIVEL